ncbi:MAG: hypothetical protein ACFFFT_15660 [Candidatus Thorarchaeota archaeon]
MVYFQISPVGFNCGIEKNNCDKYPDFCKECVKTQLERFGLDLQQNVKFTIIDSEEKRIQMSQDQIWQKFLDVLNLKHILLITKDSGLPILDYPISGAGVNTEVLTGFIQANITFSKSGSNANSIENYRNNNQFYEFQYETFNILLKDGEFIRICLVLDHKASIRLKTLVSEFLQDYETRYLDKLERVVNSGLLNFDDTIDFIIEMFNIKLVFPMTLTHTFLPEMLDSIKKNPIQKAIIDFAHQFLSTKQFFFIINLLDEVQKIVNIDANKLLYEISLLLERSIIIPTTIEFAETKILQFQETQAIRIAKNELISSITSNDDEINILKEKAKHMSEEDVRTSISTYIKKAETAEKGLMYKEAQKEYEKALFLATGFDLKEDIGKISFMILEVDKKIRELDLEYTLNAGEKAEKRKDYINAINYYQQGLTLLKGAEEINGNESRIKKLEKKIQNLQKHL